MREHRGHGHGFALKLANLLPCRSGIRRRPHQHAERRGERTDDRRNEDIGFRVEAHSTTGTAGSLPVPPVRMNMRSVYIDAMKVGIAGASGYTGAELFACSRPSAARSGGGHRPFPCRAARRRAYAVPPGRLSRPALRGHRPGGLRRARPRVQRPAARRVAEVRARAPRPGRLHRRPGGRLPVEGPRSVPAVVRRRHMPRRAALRSGFRPARAVPRRPARRDAYRRAGCYPTAAGLALAPLVCAGADRAGGIIVDAACGVSGAGKRPQGEPALRHGGRGLHGVRPARPPPHPRDRADPRRPGPLHSASGADDARHPRHVLRPADAGPTLDHGRRARARCTRLRRRALRRGDRRAAVDQGDVGLERRRTSPPATTRARVGSFVALRARQPRSRAASGQAIQCANVALGLPETAGLPLAGCTRERHRAEGFRGRRGLAPASRRTARSTSPSSLPPTAGRASGGVFTTNLATAAPVQVSRTHLAAAEGKAARRRPDVGQRQRGDRRRGTRRRERRAAVAGGLGAATEEMLVCSTGLIGIPFPIETVEPPPGRHRRRPGAGAARPAPRPPGRS